jgi:CHAT domain-containing protein
MPGMLDLAFPDRSRLQLASGAEEDTAGSAAFLAPPDIRAFRLASPLVVLSGSTVVGHGQSPADSRLAVVADFLEAGAAAVLVSVWPADEKVNADFATDLYGRLKSDPDIERAFIETRRARIRAEVQTNLDSWAGFQLFIR